MGNLQLAVGSLFANRFEIERAAGRGGMGMVYRAKDRHSGEVVALKLLHADRFTSGHEELNRFAREAQLLSELRHPSIVAHVAHGQTPDGQRFLAMEWLNGQDLSERLCRGPLLVRDCLRLLEQIADALCVAHQRGIIHRDLKPSNLFLVDGDMGRVKLLDFGIARRIAGSEAMTRTGMVVGTPEYMAPEQARGSRDLTPAVDLFSLGCVLYECLTGQPPFVADHIAAVLVRILYEDPLPIEQIRPEVPASLVTLISRLLAKDPTQRMADAAVLRAELSSLGELPEPALEETLASPKPKAETFAEQEQSLFSVVLAAPAEEALDLEDTQPRGAALLAAGDRQALLQALARLGGTPDFLANGTLLVTVPPLGSAQDQVTQADRVALHIKERWPEAAVSLATGRGTARGRTAVGEVVEAAARSLKSGSSPAPGKPTIGVQMDPLSAKLLEGRFVQTLQPGGALLLHEERDVDASRPLLGKPTPCVGREAELGTLESLLSGCIEESQARAILITAPPGAGKSRLRHEFLRRMEKRSDPVTVLLGRGELLNAGAAYGMVGRAIRRLCEIAGSEAPEIQQTRLRERISRHLPAAAQEEVFLFLGELCGVPFAEAEYPRLRVARQNPKLLPERLRHACLSWLAAECAAAPVLFVLDDLHWGDERTVALIDEALRELRGAPLLIIALARSEVHTTFPSLWQSHNPSVMVLKELSPRACERLIQQVLSKQVSAESVEWMVAHSGGNALFLEELIRAAAEGPLNRKADTVIAMLQARIGHLEPGPRRAVLAASVFGQTLWHDGVARLLDLPGEAPEVESWMRMLTQAELIESHGNSRMPGQKEYGFRHALVRDAAYGLLTHSDQRLGHKLVAAFLQEKDPQINPAILAHHYRKAEIFDQALTRYIQAGERAINVSLTEEALAHYVAADEIIRLLPSTVVRQRLHVDILIKRVHTGMMSVAFESQLRLLDEARTLLQTLRNLGTTDDTDRLREAYIDFNCARIYNFADQPARALPYFQRVLPVAQQFGDQELLVLTSQVLLLTELLQGQIGKACETMRPLLGPIEQLLGINLESMRCLIFPAEALTLNGQVQAANRLLAHAYTLISQSKKDSALRAFVLLIRTACHGLAVEWQEVIDMAQEAIECATKSGQTLYLYLLLDFLAWAQSYCGMPAQALHSRAQAVEVRRPLGRTACEDWFEAVEAELLLNAGRPDEALSKARLVSAASIKAGSFLAYATAERAWGSALGRLGADLSEAEAHLATSLEICKQTENVSAAILAELWWGRILREHSHEAAAQEHFENAFKRMEAGGYEKGLFWARRFAASS